MYRIIQVDSWWVVCAGQAMLMAFDSEDAAIKTVKDAENLMTAIRTSEPALKPPTTIRPADPRHGDPSIVPHITANFVERRGTSRPAGQDRYAETGLKTA